MKERITGTGTAVALVAAVVVLLVLVPAIPVSLSVPVEKVNRRVIRSAGTRIWGVLHASSVNAENVRLKRELDLLKLEREDFQRLQAENDRLRGALGYLSRRPEGWIAAGVLSSGGGASGVSRTVRIDCGSKDGVRCGAPALVPEGLVGRVTDVQARSAVVTLLTDPGLKVSCLTETGGGVPLHGIVSGGTDELLSFGRISGDAEVTARTRIVTSGLGGVYPPGLAVGTVLRLTRNANGVLDHGEIIPAVDFNSLEDVFIRREE